VKLLSNVSLVRKLLDSKKFRDSYVYEHIRNGIPFQIRALREERRWTQGKLGEEAQKPRNVITRLEDPNYGKLTLKTLFEIASAFDVALLVKFVPFSRLLREYEDVSPVALSAQSIHEEESRLTNWATARDRRASGGLVVHIGDFMQERRGSVPPSLPSLLGREETGLEATLGMTGGQ
jgi:transcriptional regulator with XRE-family HTH domain